MPDDGYRCVRCRGYVVRGKRPGTWRHETAAEGKARIARAEA